MKRTYSIIHTNCDCASDTIARVIPKRGYVSGPKCPGCGKILGLMQWRVDEFSIKATGEMDALQKYRKVLRDVIRASDQIFKATKPKTGHQIIILTPSCAKSLSKILDIFLEVGTYRYDGKRYKLIKEK